MPRLSGLNGPLPAEMQRVMGLFTLANYKFSTNEPGRPSTFYFQDMIGLRGRYRRGHGQAPGTQVIFQGRCKRLFVSPPFKGQLESLTTGGVFEDNLTRATYGKFLNKLDEIYEKLQHGNVALYQGRASLRPTPGWHVFDTDGENGHCSSGTIMQADQDPANFFHGGGFAAYNGAWSIW
jgi:hypothetical protein